MSPAPLEVGLALGGADTPDQWAHALDLAQRADALGLHSAWLPEGHFRPGATPSPVVGLAAIAGRTRRLRLGTSSLLLPLHHPVRVAAELATLDALSGGRLLLGLGRGFQSPVFAGFGVAPSTKRDRFDEALDAVRALWSGERVELDGEYFGALEGTSVQISTRPVQQPHPPLFVAAFGPKGLRQAARHGLPYLASPLETLPVLEENYAHWREHLSVPFESLPAPRFPALRTLHVAASDAEAERVLSGLRSEQGRMLPRNAPPALARAASGRLEDRVIVGTRAPVEDALAGYRERLGLDLAIARVQVPGAEPGETEASLEALAEIARAV